MKLAKEQLIDGNNITVLGELGHGAFASVYKAYHGPLSRLVAVKVLDAHQLNQEALARFRQEAKLSTQLNSTCIVRVFSFGELEEGGTPFFVMEFVQGESLGSLLEREGLLPWQQSCELILQVLEGLAHAHSFGILHRDLKPANILITDEDPARAKVTDFGLAKFLLVNQSLTRTGEVCGTPQYMSPEQIRGDPLDAQSDLYSVGCILYECLSGSAPFEGDDYTTVAREHFCKELPPITDVPPAVNQVLANATAKNISHRYKDAKRFAADLREAMNGGLVQPLMPVSARARHSIGQHPILSAVICTILLCSLLVYSTWLHEQSVQQQSLETALETAQMGSAPRVVIRLLEPWRERSKQVSHDMYLDLVVTLAPALIRTSRLDETVALCDEALHTCRPQDQRYEQIANSHTTALELKNQKGDALNTLWRELEPVLGKKETTRGIFLLAERYAHLLCSRGRRIEGLEFVERNIGFMPKGTAFRRNFIHLYAENFAHEHADTMTGEELLHAVEHNLDIQPGSQDEEYALVSVLSSLADLLQEDKLAHLMPASKGIHDPHLLVSCSNAWATYYSKMGEWDKVRAVFAPWFKNSRPDVALKALILYGQLSGGTGHYDSLAEAIELIDKVTPDCYQVWVWRAQISCERGNRTLAAQQCRMALNQSYEGYRLANNVLPAEILQEAARNANTNASEPTPKN